MTPEELIEQAARGLYADGVEMASEAFDGEDWPWEELPDTVKDSYRQVVRPTVARVLKAAAEAIAPKGPRRCDCTSCDCGNSGDAQSVAQWDAEMGAAQKVRALSPPE
jgi:hypothetical protein